MPSYGFPTGMSINPIRDPSKSAGDQVKTSIEKNTSQSRIPLLKYTKISNRFFSYFGADMAIGLVFFNPSKSVRLLMNYLYTVEKLKAANIPYYTVEVVYNECKEIDDAIHIKAREENVMFQKEKLCRMLEKKIPIKFSKLLFMDADIVFENPLFYSETSRLLNDYDIVQPFTTAKWLNASYNTVIQERKTAVLMNTNLPYDSLNYHPGFAWAFKRSWFKKVGFYEYAITGSGDTLSVAAWLQILPSPVSIVPAAVETYKEFFLLVAKHKPTMTCASGAVLHLWHGKHAKRQYVNRHTILHEIGNVKDILEETDKGIFDFKYGRDHEDFKAVENVSLRLKKYFQDREDDEV